MSEFMQSALGTDLLRILGVIGFMTYVCLYTCLSLRVLHSDSVLFLSGNIAAATLVLLSLAQDFNLAAALIQSFWIAMGIPAIILRVLHKRSDRRADRARAESRENQAIPPAADANAGILLAHRAMYPTGAPPREKAALPVLT